MIADCFIRKNNGPTPAIFLPGWATDYRIFGPHVWPYDAYFLQSFEEYDTCDLIDTVRILSRSGPVTLIGFSLGGFLAARLALDCLDSVARVMLFGVQKQHDPVALETSRQGIRFDRTQYLKGFYRTAFSSEESFQAFESQCLVDYLSLFSEEYLLKGLDLLENLSLDPQKLDAIDDLSIYHGTRDQVAPFLACKGLSTVCKSAKFFPLKGVGHVPFFEPKGFVSHPTSIR